MIEVHIVAIVLRIIVVRKHIIAAVIKYVAVIMKDIDDSIKCLFFVVQKDVVGVNQWSYKCTQRWGRWVSLKKLVNKNAVKQLNMRPLVVLSKPQVLPQKKP